MYHDDSADYATNEPTMDGTAGAIFLMAHYGTDAKTAVPNAAALEYSEGAVVRGDPTAPRLALVFTGGEYTDGAEEILATLADRRVHASFFLTGDFLKQPGMADWVRRAVTQGHYVGPHSHAHPLLAPWNDRDKSLVTKEQFLTDLRQNLSELRALGAATGETVWFIPPYEWYNAQHARWSEEAGCRMFNFTPGTGSHRDFAPEGHKAFRPSQELLQDILSHETTSPTGLNGHLLLLHLEANAPTACPRCCRTSSTPSTNAATPSPESTSCWGWAVERGG